jgi:hypothetical protein
VTVLSYETWRSETRRSTSKRMWLLAFGAVIAAVHFIISLCLASSIYQNPANTLYVYSPPPPQLLRVFEQPCILVLGYANEPWMVPANAFALFAAFNALVWGAVGIGFLQGVLGTCARLWMCMKQLARFGFEDRINVTCAIN